MIVRNLERPDEVQDLPSVTVSLVDLGDLSVGRQRMEPGWRWSTHVKPLAGTELCHLRHVGLVLAGRARIEFADGTTAEIGPGDVYDIPPGHDGAVLGDEAHVAIEWSGSRLAPREQARILAAILFTDIVGSTVRLQELGEARWHDLAGEHNEITRDVINRARGREVKTTGDGFLALFDGAEAAVRAASRIRDKVALLGLSLRQAVHVGEVEVVGEDVRGLAVHEAARMLELAGPSEILVSGIARDLASHGGLTFEDAGEHELRGVSGARRLFRVGQAG